MVPRPLRRRRLVPASQAHPGAPRPPSIYRAFAKLNLGLWVLGERPDGYHEIATIFQSVDLADELTFEDAPDGVLDVHADGAGVPSGPANLAHQAAALMADEFRGRASGVRIRIRKAIPAGSGLGGGSSDAAATLTALNDRWDLGLEPSSLEALGSRLGSDVPFFIRGGTQIGRGRGDTLEPLPLLQGPVFVVVIPDFTVSTAWAYGAAKIELTGISAGFSMVTLGIQTGDLRRMAAGLGNDLESAVASEHPEVEEVRGALLAQGLAGSAMTGSGSAVFGVTDRLDLAEAVRADLGERGWAAFLVRPCSVGNRRIG